MITISPRARTEEAAAAIRDRILAVNPTDASAVLGADAFFNASMTEVLIVKKNVPIACVRDARGTSLAV